MLKNVLTHLYGLKNYNRSGGCPNDFQNHPLEHDFFKNGSNFTVQGDIFEN